MIECYSIVKRLREGGWRDGLGREGRGRRLEKVKREVRERLNR